MFITTKGEFIANKGETIVRIKRLKNIITNVFITVSILSLDRYQTTRQMAYL